MYILIIEDDRSILSLYRMLLSEADGYIVSEAPNKQTALELLQSKQFDVVVFDGCLDSSEHDTGDLIRLAREISVAPIIIATSSSEKIRGIMINEGCTDSLDKEGVAAFIRKQKKPVAA